MWLFLSRRQKFGLFHITNLGGIAGTPWPKFPISSTSNQQVLARGNVTLYNEMLHPNIGFYSKNAK